MADEEREKEKEEFLAELKYRLLHLHERAVLRGTGGKEEPMSEKAANRVVASVRKRLK